jgi:hypothetical protein
MHTGDEVMIDKEERKRIVENEWAYLPNGLKCRFAGYADPYLANTHCAMPGSYVVKWEKIVEVIQREDRRFRRFELLPGAKYWGGLIPKPEDFQTPEDYEALVNSDDCWW